MATKRAADVDVETWGATPASAGAVAPQADESMIEQSPIERVMVALQDSVEPGKRTRLQLYRLVPDTPGKPMREEWCTDLTPDEFEAGGLGAIRDTWGPGGYVAHLMGYKRGSPYFTRVASPRFSIAPLPGAGARPSESSGALAGIESAMRSMAESQARLIEALAESRAAPAVNPVAQMQETLGLMTAMREAMGLNNQQAPRQEKSSIGEIVEAIRELKEVSSLVNPDSPSDKTDIERLIEMGTPLLGMVQQAMQSRPQTPSQSQQVFEAPQLRVPKQFGESSDVSGVQSNEISGTASNEVVHVKAEVSQTPQTQSPISGIEQQTQEIILNELQMHLKTLVSMAEKGESIEKGAELVYDKLPDDWIELLHMEIWWSALSTAAPNVVNHAEWFKQVRDQVVKMFAEDENDAANQEAALKGA